VLAVAMALFNKGVALGELGQRVQAIAAYEELERRFARAPDAALQDQVVMARREKARLT
jgi:hypothetical protein